MEDFRGEGRGGEEKKTEYRFVIRMSIEVKMPKTFLNHHQYLPHPSFYSLKGKRHR